MTKTSDKIVYWISENPEYTTMFVVTSAAVCVYAWRYYLENKVVIMKPLPERIRAYKNKFHTDRRNILDPTLASSRNWFENMKEIKNVKPRVAYSREVKTKNPIYNMSHDCNDDDE